VSLPIQKSTAENCVPADSEIGTQNFSTADSKIASQTAALPIQKLAADCAAADSKFSSQKLCRCRFRNQQRETVSLLIHKSAAMVESFQLYFFFLVFAHVLSLILLVKKIKTDGFTNGKCVQKKKFPAGKIPTELFHLYFYR
jgi:hypothetical protein